MIWLRAKVSSMPRKINHLKGTVMKPEVTELTPAGEQRKLRLKISTAYHNQKKRAAKKGARLNYQVLDLQASAMDGPLLCHFCGISLTSLNLSVDHLTPISREGTWDLDNLAFVCLPCNLAKHELTEVEFSNLRTLIKTWPLNATRRFLARLRSAGAKFRQH